MGAPLIIFTLLVAFSLLGLVLCAFSVELFTYVPFFIFLLTFSALSSLACALILDSSAHDEFLAECLKDRKTYECTALWRNR